MKHNSLSENFSFTGNYVFLFYTKKDVRKRNRI